MDQAIQIASAILGSPIHSCHFSTGQLAGDDGGGTAVAVLEDLEQVVPLRFSETSEAKSSRMSTSVLASLTSSRA